eukprot:495033-Amphidinium_carterae.1
MVIHGCPQLLNLQPLVLQADEDPTHSIPMRSDMSSIVCPTARAKSAKRIPLMQLKLAMPEDSCPAARCADHFS